MAKKITASAARKMVEELFDTQAAYERYKELETQIKEALVALRYNELEIAGRGRVLISQSEQVTVPTEVALDVLGQELANKVIVTKRSVSNDIIKAFVLAGEISEDQRQRLLNGAQKSPRVSLYVRPLK